MLILTRTLGESVHIDPMEDIDPRTPVAEVFGRGPIAVAVVCVRDSEVKLGISADPALRILRAELWVRRRCGIAAPLFSPLAPRAGLTPSRQGLARRVRMLRVVRGWSQETLGELAGIHRTYISAIEQARCNLSLDTLDRLAGAFDATAAELLS